MLMSWAVFSVNSYTPCPKDYPDYPADLFLSVMETENDLQELGLYIVITIRTVFLASSILIIVSVWVVSNH